MISAGLSADDIILSFEEDDMDEAEVVKDLLDWAAIQEAAKDRLRQGSGDGDSDGNAGNDGEDDYGPLNTILYGPPGTGKTYTTISKAAHILTGENFDGRYDDAKAAFKAALADERAAFITFHQSYSYEDFVVGLRPDITATESLAFREHRGIFYNICERARKNYQQHQAGATYIEPDFNEVLNLFLEPLIERSEEIEVRTPATNTPFYITALTEYNIQFRNQGGGTYALNLRTLEDVYDGRREYPASGIGVYLHAVTARLHQIAGEQREETGPVALQNYILIIDEINRANISRVFGELITLLEEDKRLGADHAMEVTLPTGERFSVPRNLYLIGTMNTADKSIALVDIALRRRFHFEPMFPNPSLDGVQHGEFLTALNEGILAKKKNADFLIGHAYFMPPKPGATLDFADLMNRKVIPLLAEYFYNEADDSVFNLLSSAAGIPQGYRFEVDAYLGTRCVEASPTIAADADN